MKTDLECVPCIIRQALSTLKVIGANKEKSVETLRELFKNLESMDFNNTPAANSNIVYEIISRIMEIRDPYKDIKSQYNASALKLYPKLEDIVRRSDNSLHTAAKMAVAGNVIDFGIHLMEGREVDLDSIVKEIREIPLSIDDFKYFVEDLEKTDKILYIADNSGEIVFDKIFIEKLTGMEKKVSLAVKSGPIINDATIEDVSEAGLEDIVNTIEAGYTCIGVDFGTASEEFLKEFKSADLIISKGQGNFETLDDVKGKKIYFLLKAKCEKISRELGVDYLDIVFKRSDHSALGHINNKLDQ